MKVILLKLPVLLSLALLFPEQVDAQKDDIISSVPDRYRSVSVTQNTTNHTLVNVGQVAMWIFSNGLSARGPTGNSGFFFPRGSNPTTTVIFQDQLIWGGQVLDGDEPLIRVGGGQYAIGHVPGKILSPGVPEDRTDPNVDRVWRIRRDFMTADLQQDAAEFNVILASQVTQAQMDQVRNIYRQDWLDWPAERGAPFYDADGDGQYLPVFNSDGTPRLAPRGNETFDPILHADEPGIADADQVVWLVTNDLDLFSVANFSGSPSIGLEQQITLFAFARPNELGQIVFKRFRLIYKGATTTPISARIDSMYITQWSDPDIGSAGDDLVGVDTLLNLGYAYNGSSNDPAYSAAGLPPPACGYDFLSGPIVVGNSNDTAVFDLKKRGGFRNLPMTSFSYIQLDIESLGLYDVSLGWWNLLRGFLPRPLTPLTPFLDPTGLPVKFMVPGDPVTGTGWLDFGQIDRRMQLISGPFTMAVGDTQEIVVAALAGLGSDRLTSISVLKFIARIAQEFYDELTLGDARPQILALQATGLDRKVVLSWTDVRASIDNSRGYEFEGYNVYQGESAVGPWHRVATFDIINNVSIIFDEQFDPETGLVLNLPVQFGSDSGIQHFIEIMEDNIEDNGLVNGRAYYFGVSSYLYRAGNEPNALESVIATVQVTPIGPVIGTDYSDVAADRLAGHVAGASEGRVLVTVIDPAQVTGHNYQVSFANDANIGEILWSLVDPDLGETILDNQHQTNDSLDISGSVADGLLVQVLTPPLQLLDWDWEAGTGEFGFTRWVTGGPFGGEQFFGGAFLGPNFQGSNLAPADFRSILVEFVGMESFTDLNGNGQIDIGEPYQLRAGTGSTANLYSGSSVGANLGTATVPFSAFDMSVDPPRQLDIVVRDRDQNGQWDMHIQYDPAGANFVDVNGGDLRFNYVYILDTDYDATGANWDPTQGGQDYMAVGPLGDGGPTQMVLWMGDRGTGILGGDFTMTFVAPAVNTTADLFTFDTAAFMLFDIAKGDINDDGSVDVADVVSLIDFILRVSELSGAQEYAADFNNDLAVNVADVVAVVNDILGITAPGELAVVAGTVNLNLPLQAPVVNGVMTVPVRVHSEALIHGLQVTLTYDPSLLAPLDPVLSSDGVRVFYHAQNGKVTYVLTNLESKALSLANVPEFKFEILAGAESTEAEVSIEEVAVAGKYGQLHTTKIGNSVASTNFVPETFALYPNFPNPFNPETMLRFDLPIDSKVTVEIFNILGQRVRQLLDDGDLPAGQHNVRWNGRNDAGGLLASGVYVVRMRAAEFVTSRKVMLLK